MSTIILSFSERSTKKSGAPKKKKFFTGDQMTNSSLHHSFDIDLAAQFGIEKAILIHHLQHWVRFNRNRKKNIRNGKCWTFQSRADMQAHLPYMTVPSIRHHLDELVKAKVLVTENFNRAKFDKTLWYAFVDEKKYGVDEENSKNFYERGKPHTSDENLTRGEEILTPIPDTKEEDTKKGFAHENECVPYRVKPQKSSPSAEAEELSSYFLSSIKKYKNDFVAKGSDKWAIEFDRMLRLDGRSMQRAKQIIDWLASMPYGFTYIQSAKKLRDEFDEQEMRMEADKGKKMAAKTKEKINRNRDHFLWMQAHNPTRFKKMAFDEISVKNLNTGYGLSLDSDPAEFEKDLLKLFPEVNNGRNV